MTSRRDGGTRGSNRPVAACGLAALAAAALCLGACKEKPKPKPPPPAPAPAPRIPDPVDTEALLQQAQADRRVQFPREQAPISEAMAQGIIAFADALVRNNTAALRGMLDDAGRGVMSDLATTGDWDEGVGKIQSLRVVYLEGARTNEERPYGEVTFAIQEPGEAYLLRWSATPGPGGYIFGPLEADSAVRPRASDFDGQSGVVLLAALPEGLDRPGGPGSPEAPPAPGQETSDPSRPTTVPSPGGPIRVPTGPGNPGG